MLHLASAVEGALTPRARLSDWRLIKHRLINSLWTKVPERSWGLLSEQDPSAVLNPHNFANTIGKPIVQCCRHGVIAMSLRQSRRPRYLTSRDGRCCKRTALVVSQRGFLCTPHVLRP